MTPLVSGIIGVTGAFLTLPFYAASLLWAFGDYDDSADIILIGSSFGIPAVLQIIYFFASQGMYNRNAEIARKARERVRGSLMLKLMGFFCALATVGWAGVSLWVGSTQLPIALIGIPCMVASAYYNIHSLWLLTQKPPTELDTLV